MRTMKIILTSTGVSLPVHWESHVQVESMSEPPLAQSWVVKAHSVSIKGKVDTVGN